MDNKIFTEASSLRSLMMPMIRLAPVVETEVSWHSDKAHDII